MKISKITIKQLFGIKEWQGDGKNIELVGDNGTGKTSVIDAIRYALTNSSDREFIVKNGETEGEIYIETDNGLSIDRKARTAMTDYKSVKQNGNVIPSPESFLKTIFTPLQLSPMEFISMDKKTQNATILDMIQYDWNLDTIKEWFGEIPRDVNYEQNILAVLNDIQAENGYYFMHRQDVNRDIRAKKAVIADIGSSLPIDYDGERWEKENLSELYTEIEKIRKNNETIEKAKRLRDSHDGKIRSFQADKEIKIAALDTEMAQQEKNIESELAQLEERIKALREKKDGLAGVKADKVRDGMERECLLFTRKVIRRVFRVINRQPKHGDSMREICLYAIRIYRFVVLTAHIPCGFRVSMIALPKIGAAHSNRRKIC